MEWVFAVLIVLALTGVALAATGRGGTMPPATHDGPHRVLPPGPLGAADVRAARLTVGLRGYRMQEVDELLERLAVQLEAGAGDAPADGGRPGDPV